MRVTQIMMSQKQLNRAQVGPDFQQMSGKSNGGMYAEEAFCGQEQRVEPPVGRHTTPSRD